MTPINNGRVVIVALLCICGAVAFSVACTSRASKPSGKPKLSADEYRVAASPRPNPNPDQYKNLLTKLELERVILSLRYHQANSEAEKARIVVQGRDALIRSMYTEIFPSWYGTAWDFNGTTEVPGQGKIACGYFVSTVLRDAGLRVQRTRLAQQASENIILSLTADPHIKRFRSVAIADFVKTVQEWGAGIYVVGLDIHTGFIVNDGDEVYFVHSSYVEPFAVVKERALDSRILQSSKYRVLGKITADEGLIEKWLLKQEIVTREPYALRFPKFDISRCCSISESETTHTSQYEIRSGCLWIEGALRLGCACRPRQA